jgi:hypothetical protein
MKKLCVLLILITLAKISMCQNKKDSAIAVAKLDSIASVFQTSKTQFWRVETGYFFSKTVKHKIARYRHFGEYYFKIYSEKDDFKNAIFFVRIGAMMLVNDTLMDLNNDGYRDFVLHWYPLAGCCLANIYNCYVYNQKIDEFNELVQIPNPEFKKESNEFYSMSYGHPGETTISLIKWSNNKLDTITRYYYIKHPTDSGFVLVSYHNQSDYEKWLKIIPNELMQLEYWNWFYRKAEN